MTPDLSRKETVSPDRKMSVSLKGLFGSSNNVNVGFGGRATRTGQGRRGRGRSSSGIRKSGTMSVYDAPDPS